MQPRSTNIVPAAGLVSREQRRAALGHDGATVWFTGLSGSGKSTLAYHLEERLVARGVAACVLDGDNLRHSLNRDLGFSPADRTENIRRVGEVCRLLCDAGMVALAAFISPYRADRERVRAAHGGDRFFEVHLATPITVCEQRDTKGLYARARAGSITEFSGISAPYEAPQDPELRLDTTTMTIDDGVTAVLDLLTQRGVIG